MPEFLQAFFDTADFPPRWQCGDWSTLHGWVHVISDLAIWGAYTAIPFLLLLALLKRRDLGVPRAVWLFVAFILACGSTHLIEAIIFWHPIYRIGAVAKVVTAVMSWIAVVVLVYYGPQILKLSRITEINLQLQREVQQRRNAERMLAEQAEVLRVALSAAHIGTWRWDLSTDQDARDAGLNEILGLPAEPSSQPIDDFIGRVHPDDHERVKQSLEETRRGGQEYGVEFRAIRPNGEQRWIRGRGRLIRDENGKSIAMTGAAMDVTERREAEQGRAQLAAIVESSPDAILLQSLRGEILTWNSGAEHTFGFTADEAIGRPLALIVPEGRESEVATYLAAARDGETVPQFETVRRRKDGALIDVSVAISPIRDSQGKIMAISTIDRDITERNQYEEQLRRLNRDLTAKHDEMEQFVYIVSHDLKSPLVTIIGFIGLLNEELDEQISDEAADSLRRIDGAAHRMSRLIDDLLELSRIGRVKAESVSVHVRDLVIELEDDLIEEIEAANASIVVEGELGQIQADRRRARQVLQNLMTNALKYGCTSDSAKIWIGTQHDHAETRVYIRDAGPGISPEHQKRIFRLFERASDSGGGTGVGLALVAKIMQAHGGRVWVDSVPGEGATFWVAFPNRSPAARLPVRSEDS